MIGAIVGKFRNGSTFSVLAQTSEVDVDERAFDTLKIEVAGTHYDITSIDEDLIVNGFSISDLTRKQKRKE